ncbi:MAG TPA: CRTAC1 family protein [Candidatus Angelobacter sp.]|nr:CRTAC1 family protein [Candidatus Angelobacter sp.]
MNSERSRRGSRFFLAGVFYFLVCTQGVALAQAQGAVHFTDITQSAGIHFLHHNGAFGRKYLPETLGPGCAFLDYDNDGYPDILLVNGDDWPDHPGTRATLKLFHNERNGTFTDVTERAGLAVSMYGMGVAVGDYDNDGFDDIFVSALGQSRLFHNNGNGTFRDVTAEAGLSGIHEFSTSAAWLDYDRDGNLDLLVANYVQWAPAADLNCSIDGTHKSYCTPESYKGTSLRLWRNLGNGKFEDVTKKAGLYDSSAKSLGIAILDYNDDGWIDFIVANDTQPNKLYVNNQHGGFSEVGIQAGIAFSEDGMARAGMGVDVADYDRSGRPSVIITNFSNQMLSLYHNEGNGLFVDDAPRSTVGRASLLTLGFGCFFFDYDLDGWPDIFVANGHIDPDIERTTAVLKYRQPPHLFRNLGHGKFAEVTASAGSDFRTPRVARGAAYADIDNDGDLDILVTTNAGPAVLFRNDGGNRNHALRVKLQGTKSNRDGIGAVVHIKYPDGSQSQLVHSGSSYISQSELVLTFGLGQSTKVESLEINWPSGLIDKLTHIDADRTVVITEGKGLTSAIQFTPSHSAATLQKAR